MGICNFKYRVQQAKMSSFSYDFFSVLFDGSLIIKGKKQKTSQVLLIALS
jgi:hypothetical protein